MTHPAAGLAALGPAFRWPRFRGTDVRRTRITRITRMRSRQNAEAAAGQDRRRLNGYESLDDVSKVTASGSDAK